MSNHIHQHGKGDSAALGGAHSDMFYVCPMHSEVRQKQPGRCPKCQMHLVPEGEAAHGHHHHGDPMGHTHGTPAHSHGHAHGHGADHGHDGDAAAVAAGAAAG